MFPKPTMRYHSHAVEVRLAISGGRWSGQPFQASPASRGYRPTRSSRAVSGPLSGHYRRAYVRFGLKAVFVFIPRHVAEVPMD